MKEFSDRTLLIATKHGKEHVIAPVFRDALHVTPVVAHDVDTDQLGTFTNEKPRTLSPRDAAIAKCEMALNRHGGDLAVASEGSFGAHPVAGFLPCDEELLVLIDRKNNLQISASELSLEVNYGQATISTAAELETFAQLHQFPSQGIILSNPQNTHFLKECTTTAALLSGFLQLRQSSPVVHAETDMRAHRNPARMKVIRRAALKLIERIKSQCPVCSAPGFWPAESIPGLPCSLCGLPTRSARSYIWMCAHCNHRQERPRPDARICEEPTYCDYCNP